jgi:hypothetical protein
MQSADRSGGTSASLYAALMGAAAQPSPAPWKGVCLAHNGREVALNSVMESNLA